MTHVGSPLDTYCLVPLHENWTLAEECCSILNRHWKRSYIARMHSLMKSCPALPTSFAFLEGNHIIGYAKICRILNDSLGCWIESVIVRSERRGEGKGRLLMQLVEDYAKRLQFKTAYLVTEDKEKFYRHLGYESAHPVCVVEGMFTESTLMNMKKLLPTETLAVLSINVQPASMNSDLPPQSTLKYLPKETPVVCSIDAQTTLNSPPPPPSALPLKSSHPAKLNSNIYLKKSLV